MVTDYVTTPMTGAGKLIFGLGCAVLTFVIREFANMPEGCSVLDPADEPADSVHRQADHDAPLWGKARSEKGGEVTWQRQRHLL